MNEINQINDVNQKVNTIIEEIKNSRPKKSQIINNLYDLRTKEEYQSLSDSEFYDIVGKTFISNPEYFMKNIYIKLREKIRKKVNGKEMDKYIFENFCLKAGEQILYECEGKITQSDPKSVKTSVNGMLYVTNLRIIAQGTLSASGGETGTWDDLLTATYKKYNQKRKAKTGIIDSSTDQELSCYGYQFKIKNLLKLRKEKKGVTYIVFYTNDFENIGADSKVSGYSIWITLPYTKEALSLKLNTLYDILCKNINNPLIKVSLKRFKAEIAKEYPSKKIVPFLKSLRVMEEYQQITDVEYLDIVRETYNLNPKFFMKSIYPKMKSWKVPSFLKIKNELFEILRKEGANIQ